MQSAPNPHRLGASQHEASRLTQTCVQRTGCGTWFGFTVPTGTPRDIVDRLNTEIGKALAMPELKKQLALQGIDVGGGTPEQFGVYMRDEFAKWGRLVKESGMTAD